MIDKFDGNNSFLSNFYPCTVIYDGLTYSSSEAAYQAAKCANISMRAQFTTMNPSKAKRMGRNVILRDDWERVKLNIMKEILIIKFTTNPDLAEMLLATGEEQLVEGNTWNDHYWGICNGVGQNHLGKLLEEVRAMLRTIKSM